MEQTFKAVNGRRGGELGVVKATWMNIAFTHKGLLALGAPNSTQFPRAFTDGMKGRADVLGDRGESDSSKWIRPFRDGEIHALMIVASDSQEDLGEHVLRYVHNMGINGGVQLVYLQEGAVREDEPGHEHFGFRDGVSQPGVRNFDPHVPGVVAPADPINADPGQDRLHAGEFVLSGWSISRSKGGRATPSGRG
jgi:deferrochelatase/peroxidase EfeB